MNITIAEYAEQYKSSKQIKPNASSALSGLFSYLNNSQRDPQSLTASDWEQVFHCYSSSQQRVINMYKQALVSFFQWLMEQDYGFLESLESLVCYRPNVQDLISFDENEYFSSFSDFQKTIENITYPLYKNPFWITDICMLYLTWYGISQERIISLKKTDVLMRGDVLECDGVCIDNSTVVKLLGLYAGVGTSKCIKALQGINIDDSFCPSEYLFRTSRTPHITKQTIRARLVVLNRLAERKGVRKSFSLNKVSNSAIFCDTYDSLTHAGIAIRKDAYVAIASMYEKLFQLKTSDTRNLKSVYAAFYLWCEAFRPEYFQE